MKKNDQLPSPLQHAEGSLHIRCSRSRRIPLGHRHLHTYFLVRTSNMSWTSILMEQRIRRMNDAITPFTLAVPQADLEDLNRRIDQTRWPDAETVDDWTQGAPLAKVKALVDHWRHRYDWRRCEAMLNNWSQYKTTIDGLDIHFLHVRSKHENALPLIITHGWPGSVVEFMKIIGPLTDPTPHGGRPEDAFHVVAPSLPGHGFSDKPTATGWDVPRIANAWIVLMRRLGYTRWV